MNYLSFSKAVDMANDYEPLLIGKKHPKYGEIKVIYVAPTDNKLWQIFKLGLIENNYKPISYINYRDSYYSVLVRFVDINSNLIYSHIETVLKEMNIPFDEKKYQSN